MIITGAAALAVTVCTIELVVATIVQDEVVALTSVVVLVVDAGGGDGVQVRHRSRGGAAHGAGRECRGVRQVVTHLRA